MKAALLIFLFVLLHFGSFGQKIRFTDSTNQWNVLVYSCGGDEGYAQSSVAVYLGDTMIHGLKYRRMNNVGLGMFVPAPGNVFVREDTLAQQVYAISPFHDTDTAEYILYDYNLQLGDTLTNFNCIQRVGAVDSVRVNGVWHRTWRFDNLTPPTISTRFIGYTVIEGIGCTSTPIYPYYPYFFEHCFQLTCFRNNGATPLLSDTVGYIFDNNNSCGFVDVNNLQNSNDQTKVFPNPINGTSKLRLPHLILSGNIIIQNSIGQVIANIQVENQSNIGIANFAAIPGIYCYHITDYKTGQTFTGKFVKQ